MMKNWKTTLSGLIAGGGFILDALLKAYEAGTFTGKHGGELVIGLAFVILGAVSKDKNVTGGTVQQ